MSDEQTDKTDTKGKEADTTVETSDEPKSTTPLIDIANQAAKRMEDANKETARLFELQEKRDARIALGGEGGGRVESTMITEDQKKKIEAAKFFEGTSLEKAIQPDEKK